MKRRLWESAVMLVVLAVIVGVAIAGDQRARGQFSYYSTYDTGPLGYRALYEVLQRADVPVSRFERSIGLLDPDVGTLIVSSNAGELARGSASDFSAGDLDGIMRFVKRGGRLVILDDRQTSALVHHFDLDNAVTATATRFEPVLNVATTNGVRSVEGHAERLYALETHRDALPLLGVDRRDNDGVVALERPLGKGRVIAITAPDIFSNARLVRADNARFAYQVLVGHGLIAFDEWTHGYAEDKSFWDALPAPVHAAVWMVIVILVLALIEANIRFAPALRLDPPEERTSSAYIASMAALLQRGRAARASIARFADDAMRRVRRRPNDRDETRRAIAELERLKRIEHPDDRALVRAARLHAALRKDLA